MCKRILAIGIFFSVLISFSVSVAFAENKEEAKIHFKQGVDLYKEGEIEQAAIEFERAYEQHPSYKILYNLAQAEAELKQYSRALDAYSRYLSEGAQEVPEERQEEVKTEIDRLKTLVGYIEVNCSVEGATIMIDGERRGETPLTTPITVDLGQLELIITKDSKKLHREILRIAGGQEVTIEVSVEEEQEQEPPPVIVDAEEISEPEDEPKSLTQESEDIQSPPPAEPEDTEQGRKRVWTWVAFGVGGAAAIGAGVMGGLTLSKKSSAIKDNCDNEKSCYPQIKEESDKIKTTALITDILIGVGGLGLTAGLVLFFVEPKIGANKEKAVSFIPLIGKDHAILSITGGF
ncbi:MAG: tetratricopeptide repeat protein [Proteobacteria bacterium]|nr:tetratricopeptide repeat protein [Pseudomonadota bacterium]